jgi:hypothetical protein
MLQVQVTRTVTRPQYQVFTSIVTVHGFDKLTPRAARAALEVAFGQPYGGEVVAMDDSVGYRVYKNSARKIKPNGEVSDRGMWESLYNVFVKQFEMALRGEYDITHPDDIPLLDQVRQAEDKWNQICQATDDQYLPPEALEAQLDLIVAWDKVRERAEEFADASCAYRKKAAR